MKMLHTSLTKLLGIQTPIVAAPMAGTSTGALAAQVSLAGGFGFITPGYVDTKATFERDLDFAKSTLASSPAHQLPIGAGFLGWMLDKGGDYAKTLDTALEQRVKAVWLSFGDDLGKWVQHIREYDQKHNRPHTTLIWILVNSVAEAERATKEWNADVLVAQGIESGGHGHGQAPPLVTFLSLIQRALPNAPPLIAAGGLTHGEHVAAVLMLGAAGAALGTRFLLTPESAYSPGQKDQIQAATETVRTVAYDEVRGTLGWPTGIDGRGVTNKVLEDKQKGLDLEERRRLYQEAAKNKDSSRSVVWAGTSVGLVNEISGAADVVKSVHDELVKHLSRAATILG